MNLRHTLVSGLRIASPTGVVNMHDVTTAVDRTARGKTVLTFGVARGHIATVELTDAERIALIEALGGTIR